jgi:FkbM family methyltransferase
VSRLRRLLPEWLRRRLRFLYRGVRLIPVAADWRSYSTLFPLLRRRPRDSVTAGAATEVKVRLRPLDDHTVALRPWTSDPEVLWEVFAMNFHLPPQDLAPRVIWDLGANIGLTMAHMAVLYPGARILGVELDRDNARLCRRNIASWSDRCRLIEGAVWDTEGTVGYGGTPGLEYEFSVDPEGSTEHEARAITLDSLLAETQADWIDYVKMDIEGGERRVLQAPGDWAGRVGCIRVEVHDSYSAHACIDDLRALGFRAEAVLRDPPTVLGRRPPPSI